MPHRDKADHNGLEPEHNTSSTLSSVINIPIIDIAGYLQQHPTPDPDLTSHITQQIHQAARSPGFFQITGHNIPHELRTRLFQSMETFFALPAATKSSLHKDHSPAFRGYEGVGDQMLEAGVLDRKEGFTIGAEWEGDPERAGFLQGRNQWPAEEVCPGLREVLGEYFEAMRGLSKAMFRLMALSLGLDEEWFDDFVASENSVTICRVHRYPPVTPELAGKTRGVGAHTDFGGMTLLLQDDMGGLEVFHRPTQTWHPVTPVKDAFVVNIGDMMERWTNDVYTSTLHRVISPVSDRNRYSVAFFNEGRRDQIIECIPTCLKPGEKPKYEPVQVVSHLKKRYWGSY
ncbi:hypothetical protein VMCG_08919 [Cytospora schulzeri]|uniref:Fe2OG dioxygenase domain-containing protein n=1 Tax=Cytospora schulzeri TaxID=448051 RepID=A0A423VNH6_9PEZI|nr:hypothetical protein VMCG_08919 [Valsa malicola]